MEPSRLNESVRPSVLSAGVARSNLLGAQEQRLFCALSSKAHHTCMAFGTPDPPTP
jgi:hypothetical protein